MILNQCQLQPPQKFRATAKWFSLIITLVVVAATAVAQGRSGHNGWARRTGDRGKYAIGLWGDLPYSDVQALTGVPNLIADMNQQELAFTVHDGDLKAGNGTPGSVRQPRALTLCTRRPGIFQFVESSGGLHPGDNDWTDCDRPSNGGFSSLERLDHERGLVL